MAEVVVEYGGKEVLRVPLKGPSMTIGRDPQCDLHLDNRALSRRHAMIEKRGAAIWCKDLNSQNGTFVNGERVNDTGQALNGGDSIEVGRYLVRIDGVEEARNDTPVLTLTGPEGRHRFAMVGDEIILGRAPSCDIAIGHKSISRRHLRVAIEGDHFIAEDLGSQNGTRINNRRISGPTPFELGDKVQMSEFTIEVGFLEAPATTAGPQKSGKTMMIDRSELAKAAYVEGDFERMGQNAGNISLGQNQSEFPGHDDLDSEVDATRGVPPASAEEPPPPPRAQPRRKATPPPPAQASVVINHPDFPERTLALDHDVVLLGEDGSDGDTTGGRSYANQGYVVFTKTPTGVVACVSGDRRLLTVNGRAAMVAQLQEGDTLELGLLTIIFRED